jgi:putative copper resistance protein D
LDIYGLLSVVLNGVLLTAQSLTLGGIAFLAFVAAPVAPNLGTASIHLIDRSGRVIQWAAAAVAAVALVRLGTAVAFLVGTLDITVVDGLTASFAIAGMVQAAAALALIPLCRRREVAGKLGLLAAVFVLVAAATATSHAMAQQDDRALLGIATAMHRLCAASWIGGIPYLLIALVICRDSGGRWRIAKRFSYLSIASVGVIVATGVFMSTFYIGSVELLYGTAYGLMVSTKISLLLGLLALGGMNFLAVERLRRDRDAPVLRLRRFAEVEVGVGIAIFFVAASLTSLPPAVDLASSRVTLAEYVERLSPRWPSFATPDPSSLAIIELQARFDAEAPTNGTVHAVYIPGAGLPPPRNAANIAWSEYNHHWAGLFVIAMALAAVAHRTGRASWARHWPLLFIPMAGFLAYRDAVEGGVGSGLSLGAFLREPENVQHLFFYVLMAGFGCFEWAVRTQRLQWPRAALVFPLLTATAAAGLLAHTHSIGDAKELLLIEASHTPLALLGIAFAWSRWLELRLAPAEGRIAGRVWRGCFVMVGLLLLAYREA